LLCHGPVVEFCYAIVANVLRMRRRPTIRTQGGVVAVAGQDPVEQLFHIGPYVKVVPHGGADDRQEVGRVSFVPNAPLAMTSSRR
jgi:hypothetical protein